MRLYLELNSLENIDSPIAGTRVDTPTYQYMVEAKTIEEINTAYRYFGKHTDFISGYVPNENLIELAGPGLSSRWNKYERRNYLTEEYLESYHSACRKLAESIAAFKPDYVYLPLRGAMPIWRTVKKYLKNLYPMEFTPATSSFVFYPKGKFGKFVSARYANQLSLRRITQQFEPGRIAYIDEIVSGSMIAAYTREIIEILGTRGWTIGIFGLAEALGSKFREDRKKALSTHEKKRSIDIFGYEAVLRLLGEDDRRFSGLHYLDYRKGPIVVPFLDSQKQYYPQYTTLNNYSIKQKYA